MTQRILVIDDLRSFVMPKADASIIYARTSEEGRTALSSYTTFDEVWFDHDLGGEDTIWNAVNYLEECIYLDDKTPIDIGMCYIQSANPVGAGRLMQALSSMGYSVTRNVDSGLFTVADVN